MIRRSKRAILRTNRTETGDDDWRRLSKLELSILERHTFRSRRFRW